MKGKLDAGDPRAWWLEALEAIHLDPFDRALIAQAKAEQLTLMTTDSEIPKYDIECLRVAR